MAASTLGKLAKVIGFGMRSPLSTWDGSIRAVVAIITIGSRTMTATAVRIACLATSPSSRFGRVGRMRGRPDARTAMVDAIRLRPPCRIRTTSRR
jgi:hypothetical protein